jgi:dienelactone hydrolase
MNTLFRTCIIILLLFEKVYAQKPVLNIQAINNWEETTMAGISKDGQYVYYTITCADKTKTFVKRLDSRAESALSDVRNPLFSKDSKYLVYETGNDTVAFFNLKRNEVCKIFKGSQLNISGKNISWTEQDVNGVNKLTIWSPFNGKLKLYPNVIGNFPGGINSKRLLVTSSAMGLYQLNLLDLSNGLTSLLWKGSVEPKFVVTNKKCNQFGLFYTDTLEKGLNSKILILDANLKETIIDFAKMEKPAVFSGYMDFTNNDSLLIFSASPKSITRDDLLQKKSLYIWHYKDTFIQSEQTNSDNDAVIKRGTNAFAFNLKSRTIVQLTENGFNSSDLGRLKNSISNAVVLEDHRMPNELQLDSREDPKRAILLKDLVSKSQIKIADYGYYSGIGRSRGGKFAIYFDRLRKHLYSYEISTGRTYNISGSIPYPIYDVEKDKEGHPLALAEGFGEWLKGDSLVIVNDQYDIWIVDPRDRIKPVCITNGYGRQYGIKLSLYSFENTIDQVPPTDGSWIWIKGVNKSNYKEGFAKIRLSLKKHTPIELILGWYNYQQVYQCGSSFLVRRSSAKSSPNWFLSKDLKQFVPITNIQPQSKWNWYTKDLIRFKTKNGEWNKAILCKPENFDSTKKYPVIFHVYETLSDKIYYSSPPKLANGPINPAWMCSRDYLVFQVDIHFKFGEPGESAFRSVMDAADYLVGYKWVDSLKMGLSGESHGAFSVNYIVSRTNRFAAGIAAYGMVDLISGYNELRGNGQSRQFAYETNQGRMGSTLWENPGGYIRNSAILAANRVETPILMLHNKEDGQVPWSQGLEWYLSLRRLGRRVWMLQYEGEGHGVGVKENQIDYTKRIEQFFGYYLKGEQPTVWMIKGIPAKDNLTGFELDTTGSQP